MRVFFFTSLSLATKHPSCQLDFIYWPNNHEKTAKATSYSKLKIFTPCFFLSNGFVQNIVIFSKQMQNVYIFSDFKAIFYKSFCHSLPIGGLQMKSDK